MNSGLFYCFGRDKALRPNIIVRTCKFQNVIFFNLKFEWKKLKRALKKFLDFLLERVLIGGQIESFNLLIEFKRKKKKKFYSKVDKVYTEFSHNIIKFFETRIHLLSRIHYIYIINPKKSYKKYQLLNALIDKRIKSRTIVIRKRHAKLLQNIDSCQLELKYGGTFPDKSDNFWYIFL